MSAAIPIAVASLVLLAVAHSWLGERKLIGPLLATTAFPKLPLGAAFAKATLRFAWHLTSVAWLGLAYVLVRPEHAAAAVAVVLAVSGAATFVATGGRHFAWAVFAIGAFAAATAASSGAVPAQALGALVAGVLAAIGGLHVAWALGVRWGGSAAVPEVAGKPAFSPSRTVTLLVAAGLFAMAWLMLALARLVSLPLPRDWVWAACVAIALVFAARTIGDFRWAGLFKRVHGTRFARMDDLLFTPLCFALCTAIVFQLIHAG
jgi:hypothetical protein